VPYLIRGKELWLGERSLVAVVRDMRQAVRLVAYANGCDEARRERDVVVADVRRLGREVGLAKRDASAAVKNENRQLRDRILEMEREVAMLPVAIDAVLTGLRPSERKALMAIRRRKHGERAFRHLRAQGIVQTDGDYTDFGRVILRALEVRLVREEEAEDE